MRRDETVCVCVDTSYGFKLKQDTYVKRRVGVIQKKIKDLQKMGVPCIAICTSWTRGLYLTGDERMARVQKVSSETLVKNLQESTPLYN